MADQQQRLLGQREQAQPGRGLTGQGQQREVEIARDYLTGQSRRAGRGLPQVYRNPRMRAVEPAEKLGQIDMTGGHHGAHGQRAPQPGLSLGHRVLGRLRRGQRGPGFREQRLARVGQRDPVPVPVEQRRAQFARSRRTVTGGGPAGRRRFWLVAFVFLVTMAFSAVPTPLYVLYEAQDGFGPLLVTVIFAAGVVASLFFAGHLSDWLGRCRMGTVAVAVAVNVLAGLLFPGWTSVPVLILARVISGVSIGMLTATATAYLSELDAASPGGPAPGERGTRPGRRAEIAATAANLGGLGSGPLVSGWLVQYAGHPLQVPYLVFEALMLIGLAGLALVPETVQRPSPVRATGRSGLGAYIGLAAPVVGLGVATQLLSARDAVIGFAALLAAWCCWSGAGCRAAPRPAPNPWLTLGPGPGPGMVRTRPGSDGPKGRRRPQFLPQTRIVTPTRRGDSCDTSTLARPGCGFPASASA